MDAAFNRFHAEANILIRRTTADPEKTAVVAHSSHTAMAHCYELFGLTIRSFWALPELRSVRLDGEADIKIEALDTLDMPTLDHNREDFCLIRAVDGVFTLYVPQVGGFRVVAGQIGVSLPTRRGWKRMRPVVVASGLATALYQLGFMPHHVSAIKMGSHAVAFTGPSGAGKSTLAQALFHNFGYEVMSDDLARIDVLSDGGVQIHPGLERMKLTRDSVDAFSIAPEELSRDVGHAGKFSIRRDGGTRAPLPLAALIVLAEHENLNEARVERLFGFERVRQLRASLYRPEFGHLICGEEKIARHCFQFASSVPVYRYSRAKRFDRLAADAMKLLRRIEDDGFLSKR